MRTVHLANTPETFLDEAMRGFVAAHADSIELLPEATAIVRRRRGSAEKVALLSGGGAGHEPLHAGFVGHGMLDAAVSGLVFSSPTPQQVMTASRAIVGSAGLLHIVKNYTGDLLNFGIAREILQATGVSLEVLVVDDDLASESDDPDAPGRRGTGAAVVVEKICGAAAEAGRDLSEIAAIGRRVADGSRSLAISFGGCTRPGLPGASFDLGQGEYERGIGIHGERGTSREQFTSATEIIGGLAADLRAAMALTSRTPVLAIVNNLGGLSQLETYLGFDALRQVCEGSPISIARHLVGSYVTAMDMPGLSITLTALDDELIGLWDAPVDTPTLRW